MKRWLIHATIASYIGALSWGIISHTISYRVGSHPAMYFVVWDMFCGWSAYANRMHVIGEGESGRFYELAPGPWGDMKPYGHLDRRHYDVPNIHLHRIAENTLKHTDHEPMARIFVIEECWPKKLNLPDRVWERMFEEDRDEHTYYRVRAFLDGDSKVTDRYISWIDYQSSLCVSANPRLQADSRKGRPFYAVNPQYRRHNGLSVHEVDDQMPVSAPLGN